MVITTTKKRSAVGAPSPEVPIFLQKAYHMIDTCDSKVCSWSDDGLTFIVKNTTLFETTIIPQFFKHNKFSSFVRQLNFYGFRKVKFSDSLRIDLKLEAETSKFWRFRHDKFRRGRKDLLTEIKRTPSSSSSVPPPAPSSSLLNKAIVPLVPMSVSSMSVPSSSLALKSFALKPSMKQNKPPDEVSHLKVEMKEMKQRIASMTKNIDVLTDMVKKVSVKDQEQQEGMSSCVSPGAVKVELEVGNKRKKMDTVAIKLEEDAVMEDIPIMPDWNPSSSDLASVDAMLLGVSPLPDLTSSGGAMPTAPSPAPSDDTFVDDLFQAFADEDAVIPGLEALENDEAAEEKEQNPNTPDPQLMQRIEDSLSTIPKDMHVMVANRLIDAISNSQPIVQSYNSVEKSVKADRSISVDESAEYTQPQAISDKVAQPVAAMTSIPLPLAVATLKTILSEYGLSVEVTKARRSRSNSPCRDAARTSRSGFANSLPVVSMHA